jgi:hypothetical protein
MRTTGRQTRLAQRARVHSDLIGPQAATLLVFLLLLVPIARTARDPLFGSRGSEAPVADRNGADAIPAAGGDAQGGSGATADEPSSDGLMGRGRSRGEHGVPGGGGNGGALTGGPAGGGGSASGPRSEEPWQSTSSSSGGSQGGGGGMPFGTPDRSSGNGGGHGGRGPSRTPPPTGASPTIGRTAPPACVVAPAPPARPASRPGGKRRPSTTAAAPQRPGPRPVRKPPPTPVCV